MGKLTRILTIKYSLLQGTYWLSQCTINSFAAVYLKYKGFNNTQIGLVLSLGAILSIILQPLISSFADRTKKITLRQIVLSLLGIGFLLGFSLILFTNVFLLISIVYITINSIQFTVTSLLNSMAFEYINMNVPMNFGLTRGIASIIFGIASSLLGTLVTKFSPNILIPMFLIFYVMFIISAYIFKLNDNQLKVFNVQNHLGNDQLEEVDLKDQEPSSIFQFFIRYKKFTLHLVGVTCLFYSHCLLNTYAINIVEDIGGNSSTLGLALTIAAFVELPTMAAFSFLLKKFKCSSLIKTSGFFFFIKALTTWIAPNIFTFYLSQTFQMLGFALYTPAAVYYVNSIIPRKDQVKGQGMIGVASLGIAGTLANLTGGRILDSIGVSYMLLISAIIAGIGFLILLFTTQETSLES